MSGDEPDHRDETWCLYDGEIIDDELLDLWSEFGKGVCILVILDSCHSGTAVKGRHYPHSGPVIPSGPSVRPKGKAYKKRMPRNFVMQNHKEKHSFYEKLVASLPRERHPIQASVRLISGCQDHQTSLAFEFSRKSLFTSELLHVWDQGLFEGNYANFYYAILNRIFELQSPNHYLIGVQDRAYDAQKPFTV